MDVSNIWPDQQNKNDSWLKKEVQNIYENNEPTTLFL